MLVGSIAVTNWTLALKTCHGGTEYEQSSYPSNTKRLDSGHMEHSSLETTDS